MAERPARVNGARDGVKAPCLGGGNGGSLPYLAVMRDAEWRPWGVWFVRFVRFVRRIQHFVQNAGRGLADVAGDLVNRSVLGWLVWRCAGGDGAGRGPGSGPGLRWEVRSLDSADLRGGAAKGRAGAVYRDTSEGAWRFAHASTKRRPSHRRCAAYDWPAFGGTGWVGAGAAAFGLVPRLGEDSIGPRGKTSLVIDASLKCAAAARKVLAPVFLRKAQSRKICEPFFCRSESGLLHRYSIIATSQRSRTA